jgi:hypothetical protein
MITTILFTILSCTTQPYEEELDDDYSSSVLEPKITKLILINAETNEDIGELTENYTFSQSNVNVRAEGDAGSIQFQLSGSENYKRTDNSKPFSLKGDNEDIYTKWKPTTGEYTLKAIPYSRKNGKGTAGTATSVKFKVSVPASSTSVPTDNTASSNELFFQGDFTNVKIGNNSRGEPSFLEWQNGLKAVPYFNFQRIEQSSNGIYIPENKAFISGDQFVTQLNGKSKTSTRVQWSMDIKDELAYPIYHTSYDMWLHPDLALLQNFPVSNINWYSIWEIWLENTPEGINTRWSIYIKKHPITNKLCFSFRSTYYENGIWKSLTPHQHTTEPIIFGEWFNFEVYWNKNTNQVKLLVNGKEQLNFIGVNSNPKYPALNISWFTPIKHYVGNEVYDWMKSQGKTMEIRYKNFKWYKN